MGKISLMICCWLVAFGCAFQGPIVIKEPTAPRVVVKEAPAEAKKGEEKKEELFESSYLYPDLTRGYIENQAFPYLPKVWLLKEGQKIFLVGPEQGPPEISIEETREFNLPPGENVLYVERWQYFVHYGGWRKVRQVEVVKVSVAEFRRHGHWRYWMDSHYGWWLIVYPERTQVYGGYLSH
jgi:hypothetical protein